MRLRYPDWGARKLQVVLAREGVSLPRNTIHRILLRHDLVHEPQHDTAALQFEREHPNELWQMDFKGPKGWPQAMGPLSVLDDHSRYLIALSANGSTHGELVQQQLEEAFQRCGVPEGMLMDHGTPWWVEYAYAFGAHASVIVADAPGNPLALERHPTSANPGESRTLSRIAAARPGTAGSSAREQASLAGCLSLGTQPCATARSAGDAHAGHTMASQCKALRPASAPLGVSVRALGVKIDCQGKLDIKGQKWKISKALSGEWVQVIPIEQRMMVFYCTTLILELDPGIQRSTIVERWIPTSIKPDKM